MLELLYRPLIILHIITGLMAMGASLVAFSTSKWSHWHKKAGTVFFVTMLITSLASIPSGIAHEKWALVMLCVFSFHLTYSGKRYLAFRRQEQPTYLDYTSSIMILVFGILLLAVGIPAFVSGMGPMGAIAPAAFGFISISMAREDYQWYRDINRSAKLALRRHIGRMGGATIAVFTAFFVNVNFVIPSSIAWIIPTVLGSFLIAFFMRKLRLGQPIR